jgi:predicted tellurium resistance membrane protein TerC
VDQINLVIVVVVYLIECFLVYFNLNSFLFFTSFYMLKDAKKNKKLLRKEIEKNINQKKKKKKKLISRCRCLNQQKN